jgi:LmbE family N-acetylglucosaminyl deacetylase
MKRREFMGTIWVAGAFAGVGSGVSAHPGMKPSPQQTSGSGGVFIERAVAGKPHAGKVLAAVQPHADDIPLFAGGTVAKLINEGYTGYLIRATNDEKAGPGTTGETVLSNERDNESVAKALGLAKIFNLNYRNHRMDDLSRQEMRARLIFLIRLLKVDTIISYDPWGHYEENPDHYVTAQVLESACWMAGMNKDYPEHLEAGLKPHAVREKYYFARGPQLINRVVDISTTIDQKVDANVANKTQGPGGESGARLKARLSAQNLKLSILGDNDDIANRQYIKHFVLDLDSQRLRGVRSDRELGREHGVDYAEAFHYVAPYPVDFNMEEYVRKNATPL